MVLAGFRLWVWNLLLFIGVRLFEFGDFAAFVGVCMYVVCWLRWVCVYLGFLLFCMGFGL